MASEPLSPPFVPADLSRAFNDLVVKDTEVFHGLLEGIGVKLVPGRPCPKAFVLYMGIAIRLGQWEEEGFRHHLDAGLPDARELVRRAVRHGNREKLRAKLLERALNTKRPELTASVTLKLRAKLLERALNGKDKSGVDLNASELTRVRRKLQEVRENRETISYRMARERDDSLYAALSREFTSCETELANLEDTL